MTEENRLTHATRSTARRTFLATLTAGTVALAGCTSSIGSDPVSESQSVESSETFEDVGWEETNLVATVADDASISHVDLVGPDGETVSRDRPRVDDSTVAFTLLGEGKSGYTPGEYRFVATDGESTIEEASVSLEPDPRITDIVRARDEPEIDWDESVSDWEDYGAIVFRNTGNAPTFLESTGWDNAPLAKVTGTNSIDYYHNVLIPPDARTIVYTLGPVYQTQGHASGQDLECESLETETLTLTAAIQTGSERVHVQPIEYGGELRSCELTVHESEAVDDSQSPSPDEAE